MPTQITHLAIAKRYLAQHPHQIKDTQRFLDGNVMPDLVPEKAAAHCGVRMEFKDLVKRNREKVNPELYRATHDMDDDFHKGWYLHLLTDDQFYNVFLREYCAGVSIDQSSIDIFETTQRDNAYLIAKYGVSYNDVTDAQALIDINVAYEKDHHQRYGYDYQFTMPYTLAELDAFIERIAQATI